MKKIYLLIAVILLIGFTNCHKEDVPNYDLNTYSIFWNESSAWADLYYKAAIDQNGKLKHGSGTFTYENFGIRL